MPAVPPAAPDPGAAPSALPRIDPIRHLTWARAIARGVRHDFGYLKAGQEEADLVATAYLVVCEYALRFDPERGYRTGAGRAIEAACRRWRPGDAVPADAGPVALHGLDQTTWAARIAGRIAGRRKFGRGSPFRTALLCVALAVAADRAAGFDPVKAFRGWAAVEVRSRCAREAIRLQNGGTFHTAEDPEVRRLKVGGLPVRRVEGGGTEEVARDRRRPQFEPPEPDEPHVVGG